MASGPGQAAELKTLDRNLRLIAMLVILIASSRRSSSMPSCSWSKTALWVPKLIRRDYEWR